MSNLFQRNPRAKSTFIPKGKNGKPSKDYSFTNSLESYDNKAEKEAKIINWHNRMPTVSVVWHLFKEMPPKMINYYRKRMFRYLRRHGIESIASIELTRGGNKRPNNRIHFHFLLDDPRSVQELRTLFNRACFYSNLSKPEYRIDCMKLPRPKKYIDYFTKIKRHHKKVILFVKNTGLQKFYVIGKWFKTMQDGKWVKKSKAAIWQEIIEHMRNKYDKNLFDD